MFKALYKLFPYKLYCIVLSTIVFLFITPNKPLNAQINAPNVDEARLSSWFALGLRQNLRHDGKFYSFSYVGYGRKGASHTGNLFFRSSLAIVNQEFYYNILKNTEVSGALSYRPINEYRINSPAFRQEFRIYGRVAYITTVGKFRLNIGYRPELRFFLTPNFDAWVSEAIQIRQRLRLQTRFPITKNNIHRITLGAEGLVAQGKPLDGVWTAWTYRETRITCHYTYAFRKPNCLLSVGCHTYFTQRANRTDVSNIFSLDAIFQDPFRKKTKSNIPNKDTEGNQ